MKNTNGIYLIARTITYAIMGLAIYLSFNHIITAAHLLGLFGFAAITVPIFTDGLAMLGMLGRSERFDPSTRRAGLALQIGAGAVSLAANIYAGHTTGERLYGGLVVIGFVVAEWYAHRLRPAAPAAPAELTPAQKRSEAAKKAATTRKANAAKKAAQAEARREKRRAAREMREIQAAFDSSTAPVSPAPIGA